MRLAAIVALLVFAATSTAQAAERPLRFWNLTAGTVTGLYLSTPGTGQWGPNQCLNDPDKSVDHDERLTVTGVVPGRYDVKLVDKKGRSCVVRDVELLSGRPYAFSIGEKDLTDCTP
ncbi:MAG TPA: hypothetical protein VMH36_01040 [Alphaproteobacteria bacterium]|nr:hypothetical protein [Alphaproteobacteria bacterium]